MAAAGEISHTRFFFFFCLCCVAKLTAGEPVFLPRRVNFVGCLHFIIGTTVQMKSYIVQNKFMVKKYLLINSERRGETFFKLPISSPVFEPMLSSAPHLRKIPCWPLSLSVSSRNTLSQIPWPTLPKLHPLQFPSKTKLMRRNAIDRI